MMACLNEETLQAYFDGELAADATAPVIKHLAECDGCAASAFEVERAIELMASAFEDELPDSVPSARLRARIAAALAGDSAPAERVRTASGFWPQVLNAFTLSPRRFAYASVAILGLLAVLWLGGRSEFFRNKPEQAQNQGTDVPTPAPAPEKRPDQAVDSGSPSVNGDQNQQPEREKYVAGSPSRRHDRKGEASVIPLPKERDERAELIAGTEVNWPSADGGVFDAGLIQHFEKAQILLRSIRNYDTAAKGRAPDIAYERRQSKNLLYKNILLRRQAENSGNLPAEEVLGSLEPVLLDIANLPDLASRDDVRVIKERIHKMEIIGVLQVYSAPSMLAAYQP